MWLTGRVTVNWNWVVYSTFISTVLCSFDWLRVLYEGGADCTLHARIQIDDQRINSGTTLSKTIEPGWSITLEKGIICKMYCFPAYYQETPQQLIRLCSKNTGLYTQRQA